ncbi:unnamed protein product [Linum tenue]|nr:unnamed protein product [Linum tenue]CAI0553160.1 unnamed protein product [Linum tenue]
MLQLVV